MKKLILWILGILVIPACMQEKIEQKTLLGIGTQYAIYPEYLKGKVKEMHETNYWAVEQDGKFVKGKPVTWEELDRIGSIKNAIEYFDESGNLIKEENLDENNVVRNCVNITYENGKSVRWEFLRADTIYSYLTPEYDPNGYLSGGNVYRPGTDTLIRSEVYTHDGKGNYTRFEFFSNKNVKMGEQELRLNDNGRVIEVRFKNEKDSVMQTFIQEYDDNGFMNVQKVISATPSAWNTSAMKRDDHGNCIEILNDVNNGEFKFIAERTYIYY